MKRLLGRISEWSVTNPMPTIVAVISIVAIVSVIGALRLSPDSGTTKLVDTGSAAFQGTQEFRDRFGDDAIVVLAEDNLQNLVLTKELNKLQGLENCLAGSPDATGVYASDVCEEIADLGATRVVFGPATFLSEAAARTSEAIQEQIQLVQGQLSQAKTEQEQQAIIAQTIQQFQGVDLSIGDVLGGGVSAQDPTFVSSIVFDSSQPAGTPKAKFGYLFPSSESALVSVRLQPDISDSDRREAIDLIRQATDDPAFQLKQGSYELSGVPVVVEGLSDEIGGEIVLLLAAALVVMSLVLIAVFGPPLRLLPLFTAIGAAGFAFGLLAIFGGTLTMASVAVLPVVIGLAVDYAIQLQARFREAAAVGERPPAAAVIAAVRGGPVIATAALATSVGFLALLLSPIPMVREFAIALVAGIFAALTISLTAGLAALSNVSQGSSAGGASGWIGARLGSGGARSAAVTRSAHSAAGRLTQMGNGGRRWVGEAGRKALALAIVSPGRVLLVASVLALTGWVAGTNAKVVSDIRELVPGDLPALQSVDELQDATGVSGELDVIVSGDVTTPEAVAWMASFKQRVLTEQGFGTSFPPDCRADGTKLCPGPALSDLFGAGGELTQERIDAVLEAVPPYFSQAILSRSSEGDVANIAFLIPVMPLDEQEALVEDIRDELDPPAGVTAEVVGLPVLAADANSELSGSRYLLSIVGLLAVALVLLAVYRSFSRALVPLLPIALATGWSALVLEAVDIPLNPMSATLGALVIAVATEFSVILAARYHEEREGGSSVGEALRSTYSRTGTAVLASGITSIAGFGVLALSGITMLRDFGIATVIDMTVALAGVMLVLPAALVWAEEGFRPLPAFARRIRGWRPRRSRRADAPA